MTVSISDYNLPSIFPSPTKEQLTIIQHLENYNVCVDAVAGSGKTTLALHIARDYPDSNILLVTYNARLKDETRSKIKQLNLKNLEAHSFHAFGLKYYTNPCWDDTHLLNIVTAKMEPKKSFAYDIIIVDEAQDLKKNFYRFILKILQDNDDRDQNPRLCIMGDKHQTIYQCFGADFRYLTCAPRVFNTNKESWIVLPLHYTWRLTRPMVEFVNKVVLQKTRLRTMNHNTKKVEYKILNIFASKSISQYLTQILDNISQGYKDEEILVLAPSVKSTNPTHPVNQLATYLVKQGRKVGIQRDFTLDEEVKNKILFMSFHKSKGLERKVVIIMNFDMSYFDFYNKSDPKDVCSNPLYVALTRAKEQLILLHHYKKDYLPFLDQQILEKTALTKYFNVCSAARPTNYELTNTINQTRSVTVTELINKLTSREGRVNKAKRFLTIRKNHDDYLSTELGFSTIVPHQDGQTAENVSSVIGLIVVAYCAWKKTGNLKQLDIFRQNPNRGFESCFTPDELKWYNQVLDTPSQIDLNTLRNLVLMYASATDGNRVLYQQVGKDTEWITEAEMEAAYERLNGHLKEDLNLKFEIELSASFETEEYKYDLEGRCDGISETSLWEFKCTKTLTDEDYIQLAVYMWLLRNGTQEERKKNYLYNIKTNEWYSIRIEYDKLEKLMTHLFSCYEYDPKRISDKSFLDGCQKNLQEAGFESAMDPTKVYRGYPVLNIPDPKPLATRKEKRLWKSLSDEDKTKIEYWFEKNRKEDPKTRRPISHNSKEWVDLNRAYQPWENKMVRERIKNEQEDYRLARTKIDRLNLTDSPFHFRKSAYQRPNVVGLSDITCGICETKLEKDEEGIECENCPLNVPHSKLIEETVHDGNKSNTYLGIVDERILNIIQYV